MIFLTRRISDEGEGSARAAKRSKEEANAMEGNAGVGEVDPKEEGERDEYALRGWRSGCGREEGTARVWA